MSELTLTIQNISNLGQGFAFNDGVKSKIFISKTAPNDVIKAKLVKETSKFSSAKLIEIIQESELRQTAPCEYFSRCGGCSLQHLKNDFYQNFKQKTIEELFSRGNLSYNDIEWIWIKEGSRRRVNFQIDGNNKLGFFAENSHNLVEISNCLMLEKELSDLIPALQDLLNYLPLGVVTQISAVKFDNGIGITIHSDKLHLNEELTTKLLALSKNNKVISLAKASSDNDINLIYQITSPQLILNEINIDLPHNIFLQATKSGQETLIKIITDFTKTKPIKKIIDLYCGVGTYSFALHNLDEIDTIDAFEGSKIMVKSINRNSSKNNLSHKIKAVCQDLVKQPLKIEELKKYDLAIINPPRNGAKAQIEILAKSAIKNIIVVSCNPNSFMEDAKILVENGYKINKISAIDQFYYSPHLELIAIFNK